MKIIEERQSDKEITLFNHIILDSVEPNVFDYNY
jgi:hypothetical protein